MDNFIRKIADTCGDYLVSLGRETGQMMGSINSESWLVMSALAVVVGFIFLKSNR